MRHTEKPTEQGYYWISDDPASDDGWQLAYWACELTFPLLYTFSPDILIGMPDSRYRGVCIWVPCDTVAPHRWKDTETSGSWIGPAAWYGPISYPGGAFGGPIAEFDEPTHQSRTRGEKLVMLHVDHGANGGTETHLYRLEPADFDEMMQAIADAI
jgi:hypothetical protein